MEYRIATSYVVLMVVHVHQSVVQMDIAAPEQNQL